MNNVVLDIPEMKLAYNAALDMMTYFNKLVNKFKTDAPYPDLFVNAFEEIQEDYEEHGVPFVAKDQAERMIDGINEAKNWDTFNMDQTRLENDLYAISLAR